MEKELMQCPTCRGTSFSVRQEDRPYVEAGLPQVLLMGIEVSVCQHCGEELLAIPKISQLHRVIAWALTRQRPKLRGNEIRFLRKYLGLSGVDFGAAIGVTPETVSRWENEKEPMGKTAERLLRLLVATREPVESYPIETLAEAGEDPVSPRTIDVTVTQQGWRLAEAA